MRVAKRPVDKMPKHLLLVVIQESKSVDDMFLDEDEGGCNLSIIYIYSLHGY